METVPMCASNILAACSAEAEEIEITQSDIVTLTMQQCHATVSRNSITQQCHATVSRNSITQQYHSTVSRNSITQ